MLIQNYGLFWERSRIYFGAPKSPGHLKGILAGAKKSKPIDFRMQQGVYCLYDEVFQLVYIGQAGGKNTHRLFDRLKRHREDAVAARWSRFSWFGIRQVLGNRNLKAEKDVAHPKTGSILNHIEAILIAAAEPIHNRQGGRFGNEVKQYLQFRDHDKLGPDTVGMIKDIWDKAKGD